MSANKLTRRRFLSAGAAGMAGLALAGPAWSQSFPSRNFRITTATGEGGGADRDARNFCSVWRKYIGSDFEFAFFDGASGQVGYEHYLNLVEPDPHNIFNAYIGPEAIMLALQAPHIRVGEDIVYFQQFVTEPMTVYVAADSPIELLEQLVELGRTRTVNVGKSRLPHPASISMLTLGEATGATFNLIPFGGGNPAMMAAITGEVDATAAPMGTPLGVGDQVRILGVFADENPVPELSGDAPSVNAVLGLDLPSLTSSRAWAVHRETKERFPEELATIRDTMQQALADPEFTERQVAAGMPAAFIDVAGEEVAMETARRTAELAERYRDILTAQ